MASTHPHRVAAAAAALLAAAALAACGSAEQATPAAAPTTAAAAPSEAAPPALGKLRGYATVRELTETADLVARGQVEAAGFRVDEVLRAANGATAKAGDRLTLTGLNGKVVDMVHMSKLEPGQTVVLYLSRDAASGAYSTLTGDFGIFDVTGAEDQAAATTRSQAMAVSGLLAEDPAAAGKGFRTTLGQLRAVAAQVE
ncbi:hypothetical protein ACFQY4_27215 [Catellatospora bangladeshensis]|uniref:DUF5666 domain-containing protein n=1 Tax=Catellatospora bangladeshensis TaxID=310355 RepID=A0A8J3NJ24_9ACTN|nr:hypothetical protein [Catellatospora bangladeshensis]GIF82677.1 hypothetical protein Cba03nite_40260 [Catellatospora bangladeshensis]